MASTAWQVVLVPVLVASSWSPLVLALERAVVSSLPRAPAPPLAQRVVVLMMPRVLVQRPRAALGSVLPGP